MPESEKKIQELLQHNEMLMQQINEMSVSAHGMIKAQSHLESVLHNAGEGVILYNSDGTIKSLNLAAQHILGYQEVELMYQYGPQLFDVPEKYSENVPAFLKNYLTEHPDTLLEPLMAHHANGKKLIPLQVAISEVASSEMVFFDDFTDENETDDIEQYELFALIFCDLTQELEAKRIMKEKNSQLEQAYISLSEHDRIRSEFLAKISHELLTPLNGIIGMADILEHDVRDEQKEFIHVIKESGLRLEKIINNILSFDQSSELTVEKSNFNLVDLLNTFEEKFSKILLTKQLSLTLDIEDENSIPEFHALAEHIYHILDNLIDNALKFTDTGGVHISMKVNEHDETSRRVTLTIKDTGIGIAQEQQEKIFHPFTQLEDTVTRQFGGVGMGLAIVKQLLEGMNGKLDLQSQPGQGTTVTIRLILETARKHRLSHAAVDEEKLGQLKQLMEDDFMMLIETSINELQKHHASLKQHVINGEEKGVFASCTLLMNIADQLGAKFLMELLNGFQKEFNKKHEGQKAEDKPLEYCHKIAEEIALVTESLQSHLEPS